MPEVVPGYNTEQKVVTVSNDDITVNATIQAQAVDGWLVSSLILTAPDVIILFTRTQLAI